jgi:hypothetical protein
MSAVHPISDSGGQQRHFRDGPTPDLAKLCGVDQFAAVRLEIREGPDLIRTHQTAIANHVQIIEAMREEGIAVLLVEQNVRVSLAIADRAYVLDDGAVIYSGTAVELAKDEQRVRSMAGASEKEWSADTGSSRVLKGHTPDLRLVSTATDR